MDTTRRRFLRQGAAAAAVLLAGTGAAGAARFRSPRFLGNPFTLGVASGDPTSDGVVLWTRLAPDPLAPDGSGGMDRNPVTVEYEVAHDEGFRKVVHRGEVVADRALGHSVHPEVHGLEPGHWYFYRFRAGAAISPTGRTRTSPAAGRPVDRLRFAFASCQEWNDGWYTAYDHMSDEELDLVVHLGDYLYEYPITGAVRGLRVESALRHEPRDLSGYRVHYGWYKSDPALQRAHASFPWLVTMDDHELADDWAGDRPGARADLDSVAPVFRARRAAAFRALYEHQPLRLAQLPSGPQMRLHRRYRFGDLADITMLDTRQYRSGGSILGARQRDWLVDGFAASPARWQIIGNQVVLGRTDHDAGPGAVLSGDAWDGFPAERAAVLSAAAARSVPNLVVITGDRHENYAADLRADPADPRTPVVAAEFTGTSITSGGDGVDTYARGAELLAANPDLKFFNAQRGYVRVEVDEQLWRTDFRVLPYVSRPGAPVYTRASYVIAHGIPGVAPAGENRGENTAALQPAVAAGRGSGGQDDRDDAR
ncbi:alkaline phosphatase D family protein [Nocardia sp. NPDC051750]|uniref:alkaline phosphatase D family protein n=1 Tax=Nocardia sp. NPDC051750 TaxID=3364325 RepID=UPI0037B5607E